MEPSRIRSRFVWALKSAAPQHLRNELGGFSVVEVFRFKRELFKLHYGHTVRQAFLKSKTIDPPGLPRL